MYCNSQTAATESFHMGSYEMSQKALNLTGSQDGRRRWRLVDCTV